MKAPFDRAELAKWWSVEIQFSQRLNARQRRRLGSVHPDITFNVTSTGLVADPWPEKWPIREDGEALLDVCDSFKIPYRWRAAPFGHHCATDDLCDETPWCGTAGGPPIGDVIACPARFTPHDWQARP